jgi:hypothetical protein
VGLVAGLTVGCAESSISRTSSQGEALQTWAALHRPLITPRLKSGPPCPVTPARSVSPSFAPAQGTGPVYPVGAAGSGLKFIYPVQRSQGWYPSSWSGNKVLWVARKGYRGRVLVRGRQVDGPHALRFGDKPRAEVEMRLVFNASDLGEGGWLQHGSYTRVRVAGCYAWQVDGQDFTRVIVFRAVRLP